MSSRSKIVSILPHSLSRRSIWYPKLRVLKICCQWRRSFRNSKLVISTEREPIKEVVGEIFQNWVKRKDTKEVFEHSSFLVLSLLIRYYNFSNPDAGKMKSWSNGRGISTRLQWIHRVEDNTLAWSIFSISNGVKKAFENPFIVNYEIENFKETIRRKAFALSACHTTLPSARAEFDSSGKSNSIFK